MRPDIVLDLAAPEKPASRHLTDRFGIFLTGGYGGSRYYTQGKTYDKGIIVEGGVTILKL